MKTSYAPFPIDPHLTSISLAYRNESLIADRVMPIFGVGKQVFRWMSYDKRDKFTVPDSLVGRKSIPNEIEFGAEEDTAATRDYGLDDIVPNSDLENVDERHDPRGYATETLTDLLQLGREVRVANIAFDINNYPAAQRETLSGTSQWSDPTSTPIKAIHEALDSVLMRPNVLVLGQAVWTQLAMHPDVVKATNRNSGDSGFAARAAVAELFELDEIVVGRGWHNLASPGQTANMVRVWGNHAAAIYRNPAANSRGGVTYGWTAQWGDRIAGDIEEPKVGLRGSVRIRVGWSQRELVAAPDCGYFFENAVA